MRQDDSRDGVPDERRAPVRRTGRVHVVRGVRRGSDAELRITRIRSAPALGTRKKLSLDYVRVEPNEIQETGAYDLDGLFIRLEHAIDSIGAKRVVLDTIETLFSGLSDTRILRAELRRLFNWLRTKGVTAIVTGERGSGGMTRHGLEEYITRLRHPAGPSSGRAERDPAAARRQVPRLDSRSQRVAVFHRRVGHLGAAHRVAGIAAPTSRPLASRRAFPASTRCWGARATSGAAASSSPAPRARERPAWPATSRTPPAVVASPPCTSRSKSRRPRSSATCGRSASTSSPGCEKGTAADSVDAHHRPAVSKDTSA